MFECKHAETQGYLHSNILAQGLRGSEVGSGAFGVSRGGADTLGSNCGDNDGDDDIAIVSAAWSAVYASGTLHYLFVVAAAPEAATM